MAVDNLQRRRLGEMIRAVDYFMRCGSWQGLNGFLSDVRMDEPVLFLVAPLRFTSPIRERLEEWPKLRDRVKDELTKRGEDAAKVLRGLT